MIKKILLGSGLTVITNSFSFWPMKDIYAVNKETNQVIKLQDKEELMSLNRCDELVLYDDKTCNSIRWMNFLNNSSILAFKFLNTDFNCDSNIKNSRDLKDLGLFESNDSSRNIKRFYYSHQTLFDKDLSFIAFPNIPKFRKEVCILSDYCLEGINEIVPCDKELKSYYSKVRVENRDDKVMLGTGEGKNRKEIELHIALKKYFDQHQNQTGLAGAINNSKPYFAKSIEPNLYDLDNPVLDEVNLNLLEKSTILCVLEISKKVSNPFLVLGGDYEEAIALKSNSITPDSLALHKQFETPSNKIPIIEDGQIYYEEWAKLNNRTMVVGKPKKILMILNGILYEHEYTKNNDNRCSSSKTSTIDPNSINWEPYMEKFGKGTILDALGRQHGFVGLARDNNTKKVFFWTTDLGQDISVLMRYAEKINVKAFEEKTSDEGRLLRNLKQNN